MRRFLRLDRRLGVRRGLVVRPVSPLLLPQHANEHRPQHPVLLAVDQEFGEGAGLGFPQ